MSIPTATNSAIFGNQVVSNLEFIAESLEARFTSTQTTDTTSQQPPADAQPSQNNKRKHSKSNKNSKRKKKLKDTPAPSEINVADIQAMNMTSLELRVMAEKHAQSDMSQEVLRSVLKFHEEIETLIAIKALQLGITVSTIEEVFGKWLGVRRPSAWNGFLQSELAKLVFKAAGGLGSGEAMRRLSETRSSLDATEKESYRKVLKVPQDDTLDANVDTQDAELEEFDVGTQAQSSILQPRTNILTNPRCLKRYKETAEKFMDQTLAKCIPVAKANSFEVVIIAVSNHIGNHHFQITRNTVGLNKATNIIYGADGVNKMPVQLQCFLVGKEPNALVTELAERTQRVQSRVVNAPSKLLFETVGLKHWPWSRCDATLAEAGFELKLLPGARSVEETFKMPSSKLNAAKLAALDADLKANLIQLVPLPQDTTLDISRTRIQPNQTSNIGFNIIDHTQNNQFKTPDQTQTQHDIHNQIQIVFNRANTNIMEPRGHEIDPSLFGTL